MFHIVNLTILSFSYIRGCEDGRLKVARSARMLNDNVYTIKSREG